MSKKQENIVGQDIGIYKVLYECDYKHQDGHKMYHVKCNSCGFETDKKLSDIRRTKFCRHILSQTNNFIDYKEKWQNQRIRHIFYGMKRRCYNCNDEAYKWYGLKGIKIYQQWLDNPKSFEDWALLNGYKDNLTIDRIDSNKNYCPENCQWITNIENVKRKDASYFLRVDDKNKTCRDWSKYLNLGVSTISRFLRKYDEELVKEFIRKRLANPNLTRRSNQTWMNVYGLE